MIAKRTLKIIVSIALFLGIIICFNVFANTAKNEESEIVLKQKGAITNNKKLQDKLNTMKDFEDKLGGKYIDENGVLNVNFVGDVNSIEKDMKIDGVKYHSVKHTLKELNDIMDILNNNHEEFGIMAAGVDEKLNKIIIELDNLDSEIIDKIKKRVDPSAIEIKKREPNLKAVLTSSKED